jgi:hypothetical protein
MTGLRDFDRLETERLRRLQVCFNADRPRSNEVRGALQRWHLSQIRQTRSGFPVRTAWVIAGAMLLSGAAMAATRVVQLPSWSSLVSVTQSAAPAAASSGAATARCLVQRAGRRVDCKSVPVLRLAPGEQVALVVNDVRTELVGPGVAHLRLEQKSGTWVNQFEPQGWVPTLEAPRPVATTRDSEPAVAPAESSALRPTTAKRNVASMVPKQGPAVTEEAVTTAVAPVGVAVGSAVDGAWSRAASALRRGDDEAAHAALSEIGHSSDPAARDAARLAQAQLDLAAGRKDKALPLLNELARSGSTAFVRQRAQEIIASGK